MPCAACLQAGQRALRASHTPVHSAWKRWAHENMLVALRPEQPTRTDPREFTSRKPALQAPTTRARARASPIGSIALALLVVSLVLVPVPVLVTDITTSSTAHRLVVILHA